MQVAAVAIQEARLCLAAAARAGVATDALLAGSEVNRDLLADPDARIPQASLDGLLERAVRLSGDSNLGLHAAELTRDPVRLPDPLHYALESCTTLGEQVRLVSRYVRFVNANVEIALETSGRTTRVTHELRGGTPLSRRHLAERALAALTILARRHAGSGVAPRAVWFAHPAPVDTSEHERIFGAPLRFEAPVDALLLDSAQLDARVAAADPMLRRILEDYLARRLPEIEQDSVTDMVRAQLLAATHGRVPAVDAVADALAMSPRTLQRKLAAERTSYQRLVTEVRQDLARQHLTDSRLSISEIAFLLGFSDVSTFHRAFKRWNQQTPSAFRRARMHLQAG